jgi:exodeoxyribonuclease VIII
MTDFATYAAIPAVNWSTLREMSRSPRHYQHRLQTPREDTGPMRFGRAVHCSVLEPDQFPLDFGVYDGARRGKDWTEFAAVNEARTILTRAEYDTCLAVRDAVRSDPVAGPYLQAGLETEKTLEWTDAGSGLNLKSRLDLLGQGIVADLKTTRDAGPDEFAKTAARLKYVHQLSFYTRGAEAVTGEPHDAVIIAVESEAPHDVCVYELSEDDLWTAGQEIDDLLRRVAECERTGHWPGRFDTRQTLAVPWWAFEDDGLIDGGMK